MGAAVFMQSVESVSLGVQISDGSQVLVMDCDMGARRPHNSPIDRKCKCNRDREVYFVQASARLFTVPLSKVLSQGPQCSGSDLACLVASVYPPCSMVSIVN